MHMLLLSLTGLAVLRQTPPHEQAEKSPLERVFLDPAQSIEARRGAWATHHKVDEETINANIFHSTVASVDRHNTRWASGEARFWMTLSRFADTRLEDVPTGLRWRGPKRLSSAEEEAFEAYIATARWTAPPVVSAGSARVVDWVAKGKVTSVKDQQKCGSCWTFSTTGALEGAAAIGAGYTWAFDPTPPVPGEIANFTGLSEDQILDCDTNEDPGGCGGGYMDTALEYVASAGGVTAEEAWEYRYETEACTGRTGLWDHGNRKPVVTLKGLPYIKLPPYNESALRMLVDVQPVAIGFDATCSYFVNYGGGTR
jgi:cathepsin L